MAKHDGKATSAKKVRLGGAAGVRALPADRDLPRVAGLERPVLAGRRTVLLAWRFTTGLARRSHPLFKLGLVLAVGKPFRKLAALWLL